ncbi:MAG: 8-oxoguanine glycosylase ogg1 [Sclerophora amabilis]|nr:MAG: 8-oxoguanine glycosylase ogg1 [Sclerophora amabilis]
MTIGRGTDNIRIRWRKSGDDEWSCALHGRIFSLRQDPSHLHYRAIFPPHSASSLTPPPSAPSSVGPLADDDDNAAYLKHYFNLKPNLMGLYEEWSSADRNFKKKAPRFTGVRILKQDAWEALVGFICSSNNNIIRISQMVEKLCVHYGTLIGHIASQPFYEMPPASALTGAQVESHLRQLGFGYRAKYIHQTAVMIAEERPSGWLDGLRNPESPVFDKTPTPAGDVEQAGREGYRRAHESLLELQGVGPKVADCVCLMGLGWGEAVPVDTHFWQIAQRDYKFGKGKHASLTKATYEAVGNHFRQLWGQEAGWAHSVLFAADLKAFASRLTAKVEVKEDGSVVKSEEVESKETVQVAQASVVTDRVIKRELEEEHKNVLEVQKTVARERPRKRRRK